MRPAPVCFVFASIFLACSSGCGDTGDASAHPPAPGDASVGSDADVDAHETGAGGTGTDVDSGPGCDDECSEVGLLGCFEGGLRTCGQYDMDPCFEWSEVQACPEGLVCDPSTTTCREPCGDFCDPFSIVLIPDTQYYTSKQPNDATNTYRKQAQWIVDRRQSDNIQFAIHLGDITNSNALEEWKIADAAHAILDAAGVPHSVTTGNHDYLVDGEFGRGDSLFDDYFGKGRFAGKAWYGGAYGSSNINNFTYFHVGPMKFLVLSLEYAPRKDVLCWADGVIAGHADHRVIIATHCYLTHGGNYSGGCPSTEYSALGAAGGTVWSELASRNSNVFLVVSGHVNDSEYRVQKGNHGNDVHEMLVDYQMEAPCTASTAAACTNHCRSGPHAGNGWLRKLVFDPRENTIHAETVTVEEGNSKVFPGGEPVLFCSEYYKPTDPDPKGAAWYSSDPDSPEHRFSFAYDMTSPVAYSHDDLGQRGFMDRTVNSVGAGDQLVPRVAISPSGNCVVVWQDDSSKDDGAGNHDILARGFAPGGCSGFSDIVVNPATEGHQQTPAIAMDGTGNFVVAWADDKDGNGVFQIYARGFSPDGTERIPVFTVNSVGAGQQRAPAVAMAPDGRFVVAWEDGPTASAQILMRGFSADGSERFSDRSVHSDSQGQRIRPAIGLDSTARFVVVWQDDSDANGSYQIHARGFDANGAERFPRRTINSVASGQQRNPAIGVAASGAFVVAWADDQTNAGSHQILARGFSADGAPTIPDFRVHGATGSHFLPRVAMETNGSFAIIWQLAGGATGNQVHARSFFADGTEWLPQWTVHRVDSGDQISPDLALNATGTLVATWADDMDGNGSFQILASGFDSP